jgi:superoxide dismutase, Fe-Mn family
MTHTLQITADGAGIDPLDVRHGHPIGQPADDGHGVHAVGTPYVLPDLPYHAGALMPFMLAEALLVHHAYHHAAHVVAANRTMDRIADARRSDRLEVAQGLADDLVFDVGSHELHSIFWTNLTPDGTGSPTGGLRRLIDDQFGSPGGLRDRFTRVAMTVRGSGWTAVTWDRTYSRLIIQTIEDSQLRAIGASNVLLVCDMWEHAYYLQYRHDRAAWLRAYWSLINWSDVEDRLVRARATPIEPPASLRRLD